MGRSGDSNVMNRPSAHREFVLRLVPLPDGHQISPNAPAKGNPRNCVGVSVLRALVTSACARRSRGPKQKTLRREFTSACRPDARCGLLLASVVDVTDARKGQTRVRAGARRAQVGLAGLMMGHFLAAGFTQTTQEGQTTAARAGNDGSGLAGDRLSGL